MIMSFYVYAVKLDSNEAVITALLRLMLTSLLPSVENDVMVN